MKRILVVEDDAAILDIVAAFLQASDYAVETATDGLEALDKVRRGLLSYPRRPRSLRSRSCRTRCRRRQTGGSRGGGWCAGRLC